MTAATPSTERPSRSSSRDDPAAIDEHTFATPAFPFDAGPYGRFPAPLGRTDADLGNVAQRADRQAIGDRPPAEHRHDDVLTIAMFMGPLFALQGPLRRLRTVGMMRYGALATDVGARFERQWLRSGEAVTDDSLHASDFSAVTDLNAIVANVADIRFVPIDMQGAARLILATCLPFVPLALAIMPFAEILKFAASVLLWT